MSFQDFVFYAYLILALLALAALWQKLVHHMGKLELAPEKRVLYAIIAVTLAAFLALNIALKLNHWRNPLPASSTPSPLNGQPTAEEISADLAIQQPETAQETPVPDNTQPQTDAQELTAFIQTHYTGLYGQLDALYKEIKQLEKFARVAMQLRQQNPKQQALLDKILEYRYLTHQLLVRRHREVSQQIRNFWVHYKTGNQQDALNKFSPLAIKLSQSIQETQGDGLDNRRKEEKFISDYGREVGNLLKNNKLPSASLGLRPYTRPNRTQLTDWIANSDSLDLSGQLGQLVDMRNGIEQRTSQINDYLKAYPDLKSSLLQTRRYWELARLDNFYAEYRLLYTVEVKYLLEKLGMTERMSTTNKRLDGDLDTYLPKIMNHVQDTLAKAEEAYNPKTLK